MAEYPKTDYFFFELPVYRCSEAEHSTETESAKRRYLKKFDRPSVPQLHDDLVRLFYDLYGYPWRYNDVIGWIRLFVLGCQLRGDLWWNHTKRQVRRGRKKFIFAGKAFELNVLNVNDSAEIERLLFERLHSTNEDFVLKGRYIDISLLTNLSPYINWQSLIQSA